MILFVVSFVLGARCALVLSTGESSDIDIAQVGATWQLGIKMVNTVGTTKISLKSMLGAVLISL